MRLLIEYKEQSKRVQVEDIAFNEITRLNELIQEHFPVVNFTVKLYDNDFKAFCDVLDLTEIVNLSRLLVTEVNPTVLNDQTNDNNNQINPNEANQLVPDVIVEILPVLRTQVYRPGQFKININDLDIELRLEIEQAEERYNNGRHFHEVSHELKTKIVKLMWNYLFQFGDLPSSSKRTNTVATLVRQFPSLGEHSDKWLAPLKTKIYEFRRNEKENPAVKVNKGVCGAKCVKAMRGEVNLRPGHSKLTTVQNLQDKKRTLLEMYTNGEENDEKIQSLMSETFTLRREEIVVAKAKPKLAVFKQAWPHLFEPTALNTEVKRVTNIDVRQTFLQNLEKLPALQAATSKKRKKTDTTPVLQLGSVELLTRIPKFFSENITSWVWEMEVQADLQPQNNDVQEAGDGGANAVLQDVGNIPDVPIPQNRRNTPTDPNKEPPFIKKNGVLFDIFGENGLLVGSLPDLETAMWVKMCLYYTCHLSYPEKKRKSLQFLQFLCGLEEGLTLDPVRNAAKRFKQMLRVADVPDE